MNERVDIGWQPELPGDCDVESIDPFPLYELGGALERLKIVSSNMHGEQHHGAKQ